MIGVPINQVVIGVVLNNRPHIKKDIELCTYDNSKCFNMNTSVNTMIDFFPERRTLDRQSNIYIRQQNTAIKKESVPFTGPRECTLAY